MNNQDCQIAHHEEHHSHSLYHELICHTPYAIFSVAVGFVVLSILSIFSYMPGQPNLVVRAGHMLFHNFHYLHIVFAATGAILTFFRYSKNIIKGVIVGAVSSVFFCILSDILMPYLAGRILGVAMHFHVCFITEWYNIVPFLLVGVINGFLLSQHEPEKHGSYSLSSHFAHILVSSLASLFYIVSHGLAEWELYMGPLFMLMILAVVIPCTLSDVVVPMYFANARVEK
ncbi:MAG: hypothetical protein WD068_02435 [Candidatus Babeliales bacterium]